MAHSCFHKVSRAPALDDNLPLRKSNSVLHPSCLGLPHEVPTHIPKPCVLRHAAPTYALPSKQPFFSQFTTPISCASEPAISVPLHPRSPLRDLPFLLLD